MAFAIGDFCGTKGCFSSSHCLKLFNRGSVFSWRMALISSKDTLPPPPLNIMTADRVRWEHIQRVFIQCNRNVSETARKLRMHRRTLQRILNKHAPKE